MKYPIGFLKSPNVPTINGTAAASHNNSATTHTFTLPSGISAGELLIAFIGTNGGLSVGPSGWTQLINTTFSPHLEVYYRVADGSEGTTISCSTSTTQRSAAVIYRVGNYQGTPEAAQASGVDPPSLSPSWGASPVLWLAGINTLVLSGGSVSITAFPSGYINTASDMGSDGTVADRCGACTKSSNSASSENPGAFTVSGTSPSSNTVTVAVRGS